MIRQTSKIMSFKRPFEDLSIHELYHKLRGVIDYSELGNEITDDKLDMYLLIKRRFGYLKKHQPDSNLADEE